jgi:hypothetical protein
MFAARPCVFARYARFGYADAVVRIFGQPKHCLGKGNEVTKDREPLSCQWLGITASIASERIPKR